MYQRDKMQLAQSIILDALVNIQSDSDVDDCWEGDIRIYFHLLKNELEQQILLHPDNKRSGTYPYEDFGLTEHKRLDCSYSDDPDKMHIDYCRGDKAMNDFAAAEKAVAELDKKDRASISSRIRHWYMNTFRLKFNRLKSKLLTPKIPDRLTGGDYINPITGRLVKVKSIDATRKSDSRSKNKG